MPKSCVVTGGAGSLGAAISDALADEGWIVVSLDVRPLDAQQSGVVSVVGDVSDTTAHTRAADEAESRGQLAGWVNCAGYNILGDVTQVTREELERGTEVNLFGVFHGCAEAVRRMLAGSGGAVVNVSSIQAAVGFPGFAAYAMTKGGIEALTRQVAAEYVARNIRCNAVAPGLIRSELNDRLLQEIDDPDRQIEQWRQLTPMGRWGEPADVAQAVSFLLSERAAYITGEIVGVNGGALAVARGHG